MSKRLTLQDLIDILADSKSMTKKDAESFVRELFAVVSEVIEEKESVRIKDFGTFKLIKVNSRKSVDVNTGKDIEIPAHYKLGFTPDKSLRDRINAPFAHFETTLLKDGVNLEDTEEIVGVIESLEDEDVEDSVEIVEQHEEQEGKIEAESIQEEVQTEEIISDSVSVKEVLSEECLIEADQKKEIVEENIPVEENEDEETLILEKKSKGLAWLFIACLAILLLGGAYYFKDQILARVGVFERNESALMIVDQDDTFIPDTVMNQEQVDSITLQNDTIAELEIAGSVEILVPLDTIQIKYGDTMRKLGLKYYGNRSFWVYIYQENMDKIKDFNNIPIGTTLIIPTAEKYGIDVKNQESLVKAKQLETEYNRSR